MDILIQNTGACPLMVHVKAMNGVAIDRTIRLEENTVVKIPQEIYEQYILKSPFFIQRIQDGILRVLNAENADGAVKQLTELRDYAYNKYVDMMKKIKSVGGLSNAEIKKYLNADGTPTLQLLNVNFGRNIDPVIAEEFRVRYLAEESNGLHVDTIKIPGGVKVDAGTREVNVKEIGECEAREEELNGKDIDELKTIADEKGIEYPENIRKKGLIRSILHEEFSEEK